VDNACYPRSQFVDTRVCKRYVDDMTTPHSPPGDAPDVRAAKAEMTMIGTARAQGTSWYDIGTALGFKQPRRAEAACLRYAQLRKQFPRWTPPSPAGQEKRP
jgi:hypothetical protein